MADKYANKAKESRRKHGKERCGQKKSFLDRQDAFLHNWSIILQWMAFSLL